MEWLDLVIKIGTVITVVIGVWRIVVVVIRKFDNIQNDVKETKEYVMNNIKNVESIPTIEEHCRENFMTGLQLKIMNDNMPLGERIAAGIKYLDNNGNGDVKKFLKEKLHLDYEPKNKEE